MSEGHLGAPQSTIDSSSGCYQKFRLCVRYPLPPCLSGQVPQRALLEAEIAAACKRLALEIAERYELTIEQIGTDGDHIHLLVSFHPKYSIGQFVRIFKSNIARELFRQFPSLKKELWGGEFWTDGYYAATVSTAGNWKTVEAYVSNQGKTRPDSSSLEQLAIW